jgi:transposase InsO family protein
VSHPNARLTVRGRELLCERVLVLGWSAKSAALAAGVSEQTAHKWLRRFKEGGDLTDRSSRPHRLRPRVDARTIARIFRRRSLREGPLFISWETSIPRSTVYAVLARNGLSRLRDLDKEPPEPVVRYEHAAPGDLVHIDVKKLGRLGQGGGWRFGGRVAKKRHRGIGHDFIHVAVDDHSRLAYTEVHEDERADTVAGFTARAIGFYESHGITVKRILTDNAMSYYSRAQLATLAEHGIARSHTRPYRPQTNGKAERFIRLMLNGWAYRKPYDSNEERLSALFGWVFNYNHRRPHGGLGGLPPISRVPALNNVSGRYS